MKKTMGWLIGFAVILLASTAWSEVDLQNTVTFGDSLTRNDLLGRYFDRPQALYGKDPVQAVFLKGYEGEEDLSNYAVWSSTSDDLEKQIDVYDAEVTLGIQDEGTFFSIETGGNDILDDVPLLTSSRPGEDHEADELIDNIVRNIRNGYERLRDEHSEAKFIIWTIPDVTLTPKYWNKLDPQEIKNLRAHIERANRKIRKLSSRKVLVFDTYEWMRNRIKNPPVILGHKLKRPPKSGDFDCLYADHIHPTAVMNAMMANAMIKRLNDKFNDHIPRYGKKELAEIARLDD